MSFRFENVSKSYVIAGTPKVVLSDVSLKIEEREFVTIVGPSGCGKSTLLMMMAGLLEPSGGEIFLGDEKVTSPPTSLSVVFQDYRSSLFPWMNVGSNVAMALRPLRVGKKEARDRVLSALESVGLDNAIGLLPSQLSGGMQQRVAIARALVTNPEIMLMDEPLAAVDAQTRADLEDLILVVREQYDITVVFVTHDIDEAVYLADRCVVLAAEPGRVLDVINVDLPKPRDQVDTKRDPLFADLRSRVFEGVMRRGAA